MSEYINPTEYINLNNILQKNNAHERDKNISFTEEGHKYSVKSDYDKNQYTSVTTWIHSHFGDFDADGIIKQMMSGKKWKEGHKYWGMTPEDIKKQWNENKEQASSSGTTMHLTIEYFMNNMNIAFPYTHKELYDVYMKIYDTYTEEEINTVYEKNKEWTYFIHWNV